MIFTKPNNQGFLNTKQRQRGYTLVELVFYITLFTILSITVIDSLITMTNAFKETAIQIELREGGEIMDRIAREARQANDITSVGANNLLLATSSGAVEFRLVGSNIELWSAGSNVGNLNSPSLVVTTLSFTELSTPVGEAVKIALSIRSSNDTLSRVQDFYSTIVLRGSYSN